MGDIAETNDAAVGAVVKISECDCQVSQDFLVVRVCPVRLIA